jgi:hypothetical protein
MLVARTTKDLVYSYKEMAFVPDDMFYLLLLIQTNRLKKVWW